MLQQKFKRLEDTLFAPDELKKILKDERLLYAVMGNIVRQIEQRKFKGNVADYISLLPQVVDKLSWQGQETAAALYRKLPCCDIPVWRVEGIPEFVQISWVQAELCTGNVESYRQVSWPIFCDACNKLDWSEVRHPDLLWQALHNINVKEMPDLILSCIDNIISANALPFDVLFKCILEQLSSCSSATLYTALQSLQQTWCLVFACPTNLLKPLLESSNESLAISALELLFFWGEVASLEQYLDPQRIEFSNCLLALFKDYAEYQHITLLLDFAKQDFAAFSGSVVECLSTIAIKGQRIANKHLPCIFKLVAYSQIEQYEKIAFIIGGRWDKWQWLLDNLPYDDQAWTHQLALIQCVNHPSSGRYLMQLLDNPELSAIHEQLLRILPHKNNPNVATSIFRFFNQYPQTVLQSLRAVITPEIKRQLQICYHAGLTSELSDEVGQFLQSTQADIDYSEVINGAIQAKLKQLKFNHDSSGFEFLEQQLSNADVAAYIPYCKNVYFLPKLSTLLLHDDEEVQLIATQTIKDIAFILFDSGSTIEPSVVKASNRGLAGDYLLSVCIIGQLKTVSLHELKILFAQLSSLAISELQDIIHYLGHEDRDIRKFGLQCLQNNPQLRHIELIRPFLDDKNIYTLRQAIINISVLGFSCLDVKIASCLDHPNMNIKKTAAETLIKIATVRILDKILVALKVYDNPGLSELLMQVLGKISADIFRARHNNTRRDVTEEVIGKTNSIIRTSEENKLPVLISEYERVPKIKPHQLAQHILALLGDSAIENSIHFFLRNTEITANNLVSARKDSVDDLCFGLVLNCMGVCLFRQTRLFTAALVSTRAALDKILVFLGNPDGLSDQKANVLVWLREISSDDCNEIRKLLIPKCLCVKYGRSSVNVIFTVINFIVDELSENEKEIVCHYIYSNLDSEAIDIAIGVTVLHHCNAKLSQLHALRTLHRSPAHDIQQWAIQFIMPESLTDRQLKYLLDLDSVSAAVDLAVKEYLRRGQYRLVLDTAYTDDGLVAKSIVKWSRLELVPTLIKEVFAKFTLIHSEEARRVFIRWISQQARSGTNSFFMSMLDFSDPHCVNVSQKYLSKFYSSSCEQKLIDLLSADKLKIRKIACDILLTRGISINRQRIAKLFLANKLGVSISLSLSEQELAVIATKDVNIIKWSTLIKSANISQQSKIEKLTQLWFTTEGDDREFVEIMIKPLPVKMIFLYLYENALLSKGSVALVKHMCAVPSQVLVLLNGEASQRDLGISLLDSSNTMLLHTEELTPVLLRMVLDAPDRQVFSVIARLDSWANTDMAKELCSTLSRFHDTHWEKDSVAALTQGVNNLSLSQRAFLFSGIKWNAVIQSICIDLVLDSIELLVIFTDKQQLILIKEIRVLCTHFDSLIAKSAIKTMVRYQADIIEDVLLEALIHPKRTIRLFAHRMARQFFCKEDYLHASEELLNDSDTHVVRTMIRVLSYRHYLSAVQKIIPHLLSSKPYLVTSAFNGLSIMGGEVIGIFHHSLKSYRPDKRKKLQLKLDQLESLLMSDDEFG